MASSNSSEPKLSRQEAIKVLEMFLYKQCSLGRTEFAYDADTVWEAVKMAAESLKTDEAYQLEYGSTTKNNLEVDCISRQAVLELIADYDLGMGQVVKGIHALPPVTPQEPTDKIFTKADLDSMAKAINFGWKLRINEIFAKIRAEIEQDAFNDVNGSKFIFVNRVNQILDKYKAESKATGK